jgi:site-specific recombinase XerD
MAFSAIYWIVPDGELRHVKNLTLFQVASLGHASSKTTEIYTHITRKGNSS